MKIMIVLYVIVTLFVWFKGFKIALFSFGHFWPLLAAFGHFRPLLAGRPAKTSFGRLFSNPEIEGIYIYFSSMVFEFMDLDK